MCFVLGVGPRLFQLARLAQTGQLAQLRNYEGTKHYRVQDLQTILLIQLDTFAIYELLN